MATMWCASRAQRTARSLPARAWRRNRNARPKQAGRWRRHPRTRPSPPRSSRCEWIEPPARFHFSMPPANPFWPKRPMAGPWRRQSCRETRPSTSDRSGSRMPTSRFTAWASNSSAFSTSRVTTSISGNTTAPSLFHSSCRAAVTAFSGIIPRSRVSVICANWS